MVPHGVDTDAFHPAIHQQNPNVASGTILFVGMHIKDLETLLKTIHLLLNKDASRRFVLVTDPSYAGMFENCRNNVNFIFGISEAELIHLYQTSDLLLQPLKTVQPIMRFSKDERADLTIVATEIGGVKDYVTNECGILTPPNNAEAMAEATWHLLTHSQIRCKMATLARIQALRFDWDIVASRLRDVYSQLW